MNDEDRTFSYGDMNQTREVVVPSPKSHYPDMKAGTESVPIGSVVSKLGLAMGEAMRRGDLHGTLEHYIEGIAANNFMTPESLTNFRALSRAAKDARFDEAETQKVYKQVVEILSELRVQTREVKK